MTEKLKTLLDRAADVEFDRVDLDAVVTAGDRRVRRNRGVTAVAGLAAAVVVGAGAFAFLGGEDRADDTVDPATADSQVMWAIGSELHTPTGSRDLGHTVHSMVRTSEGIVYADDDGAVRAEGDETVIGTTSAKHPRLVSDEEGSLVGWVDSAGERPVFVVHDLATGESQRFNEHTEPRMGLLPDERDPAYFYALDGGTAYWRDTRGAVAVNVDSGESSVIDPTAVGGFDIGGVENGLLFFVDENGHAWVSEGPRGTAEGVTLQTFGNEATFSPDARWVSVDADEPEVFDVRTGGRVRMDVDGRVFATGFEWLDETTLVMGALRTEKAPLELLACEMPAGTCETAAEVGTFEQLGDSFVIPDGSGLN